MKTSFRASAIATAVLGCWLAMAGPAGAGTDGSPGAGSARFAFATHHTGRGNDSAHSDSSTGHWRGQSMAEWAKDWWRWWMPIPANVNPALDDGTHCGINQEGPVWFIGGPITPTFARTCAIPHGKAILSPITSFINDYPCPNPAFQPAAGQTLEDFLAAGIADAVSQTSGQAILDGKPFKAARVSTTLFGFSGAASLSAFDSCVTGSPQVGVSDGYFIVIEPLPRGDHVLQITSNGPFGPSSGTFTLKIRRPLALETERAGLPQIHQRAT